MSKFELPGPRGRPAILNEHQGQISTGFYWSLKISPPTGRRPAAELILKLSD